jgi:hypothetical protein
MTPATSPSPGSAELEVGDFLRRYAPSTSTVYFPRFDVPFAASPASSIRGPQSVLVEASFLCPREDDAEVLFFRRPVEIETNVVDDHVVWRLPELQLVAEGADDGEAEANMCEQVSLLRAEYLDSPEEELTPDGLEVKRRLLETLG